MEDAIALLNKELYALRKVNNEIALTNKILSNIVDKIPKEYFEKGEYYFDKDDFAEAIKMYSKAIELKSNFQIAYCKRGYAYFFIAEYYNSVNDFNKAIEFKSDYNDAYYARGNTKQGLKDFEGAIDDYNRAIELEPKDAYSYFFRAKAKLATGNMKGALEDAAIAVEYGAKESLLFIKENLPKITDTNGYTYFAIENLSKEIERNRNNADLYFQRGKEKVKVSDYKNSISDFQIAVHFKKDDKILHYELSSSLFNLGNIKYNNREIADAKINYNEAISYCNKAIELDDSYSDAYFLRGAAKRMLADKIGGQLDFKKAKELGNKEVISYIKKICPEWLNDINGVSNQINENFEKSDLHYKNNEFNESIFYCNKTLDLDPNNSSAYYGIGKAKLGLQDYRGAVQALTKSIEIDSSFAFAFFNRGDAKFDLENYKEAIQDYTKAIELNPKLENVYINRGLAKSKLNDHKGAIVDYNIVLNINPNNMLALHKRGIEKKYLKDDEGAIKDFDVVIENEPSNGNAYFDRGTSKLILSQLTGARADLIKAGRLGNKRALEIVDQYLKEIN